MARYTLPQPLSMYRDTGQVEITKEFRNRYVQNMAADNALSKSILEMDSREQDQEAKQNNVEKWLLQRQAQVSEFGSIIVTFTVPGNTSRHVGDLIRFEVPTHIPEDSSEIGSIQIGHQLYSGYYLISKIRHIITKDKFAMDVELIKNSFAKRIPGQTTKPQEEEVTS